MAKRPSPARQPRKRLRNPPVTMQESILAVLKTALQLVPFGIGGAIVEGFFGTIDARKQKRVESFVQDFATDLRLLGKRIEKLESTDFTSDAFAQLFEETIRRVLVETRRVKLQALRGALVSIVVDRQTTSFDKKSSFLKTLDAFEELHIHVLRTLAPMAEHDDDARFLQMQQLAERLGAQTEADANFLYSSLDTLANREFVQSGPVPFTVDMSLDKSVQKFRITALGLQFLEFVRMFDSRGLQHHKA